MLVAFRLARAEALARYNHAGDVAVAFPPRDVPGPGLVISARPPIDLERVG